MIFKQMLQRPVLGLLMLLIGLVLLLPGLQNFKLDASSEALVIQGDEAFKTYREVGNTFGNSDFLIATFTPKNNLFEPQTLSVIKNLESQLSDLEGISSVLSLLDAPIFFQPRVELSEIADNLKTLEDPVVDIQLAKEEILDNPIYSELIISPDGKTTALQIVLEENLEYRPLINKRYELLDKVQTPKVQDEIDKINLAISEINDLESIKQKQLIENVRSVLNKFRSEGTIFLGGASMIAVDMMSFIESDLRVFGIAVAIVFGLLLFTFFGKISYVFLPLSNAVIATIFTASFLGLAGWKISVVSSNFIALLLILTISLTVHVLVRFNDVRREMNSVDDAIAEACKQMLFPCFFAAFTTAVAFISLIFGEIKPVIEFGKMMAVGMIFAFLLTFTFLPMMMKILINRKANEPHWIQSVPVSLVKFSHYAKNRIFLVSIILMCGLVYGFSLLKVENRFIDYFSDDTEIYQGMYLLDKELGGTATLDIVIDAPKESIEDIGLDDDLFDDDLFEDDASEASGYWWNSFTLKRLEGIHDYLDSTPEIGKVLSVASGIKMARLINNGKDLNDLELALLRSVLPEDLKESLLYSYINEDDSQVRISTRVYETSNTLNRNQLINNVSSDLQEKFGLAEDQFRITGLAVLYNNMLQSLFDSQIKSLGIVFGVILIMFLVIFRSIKVAVIGLIPNILTASSVLGLLGILSIPLDIMTITVAAISVGMAVDNTIHYLYRYKVEISNGVASSDAILKSHTTIGRAILYTALTISIGFLIFSFSNFSPTVLFGTFTSLAIFTSLVATLILLPLLLQSFKAFDS